ncbi:hypothetical protein, partial [Campylobacter sp.]|uniref:beta strand repeat-containing protein n=1 Tax=Campylobacter sp. TaxID=205 RepID=UPI002A762FD4
TDSAEVYGGTGKNSTAKIYKIEVGKDLKVGKLDQMATVNVADKAQLSAQDFGAGTPTPVPTPTEEVNLSNKTVAADGSVTVLASDFAGYDANAAIKVDLPATATKVNLDGVNVKAVQVSGLQANAEVVIGSGSNIETLSSTENVALKYTVAAGAKVNTIIGRDLNDIIDTSAVAAGSITGTINGGAGNDTLIISGDGLSNLTSLQSIEKIVVAGTSISAKALSGVTTTLSTNKATGATLEVKATAADTNINLANLVQDTADSGDVSLNITGVASNAKVALGAADTKETVNLGASLGVVVTGVKAGDTVVSDNFAGITGSFAELGATIEAGKAYFTSNTTVTDAASAAAALSTQLATITSGNAIVAVNNGANAYVFAVNGAAANKLTLVATLDNTFNVQDSIANGALAFDGGTPVPPVEPTVDALVSYNKTEDRLEAKVSGNAALTATKDSVSGGDTKEKLVVSADANSTINFDKSVSDYAKAITTLEIRGTGAVTLNDAKLPSTITTITDTGANATINLAATTANTTLATINLGDGNDTLNLTGGRYNKLDTINAGSGDDTINLNAVRTSASSDTTVNLGDGADSLILGANFNATGKTTNVSGGAGNDIFDLSAVTNAARLGTFTFKGEEGNDTVIFGAADYTSASLTLETIEAVQGATSGDVTTKIKLETIATESGKVYTANQIEIKGDIILVASGDASGANTTALEGIGNVTIDLSKTTASNVKEIKGSDSVIETIDLASGAFTNASLTALEGIDAIKAAKGAKIAAAAFGEYHGVTTINGELEVSGDSTNFTNLDLSKVANGTANVTISGVTNGSDANNVTLTLTKAAGIVDTVKLGALNAASGDLIINGAQSGDKVDVKTLASSGFALWSKGVENAADTAYYVNDDALKAKIAAGTELAFTDLFKEASSAAKSFAFVQTNNGINIYEASGDGTGATDETVSLIGTIVGVASVEQTVNDIKVVSVF